MKIIKGDLLHLADTGNFDLIVHGCNCMNTFGAGIARQIAIKYPKAELVDSYTTKGHHFKLGTYTMTYVQSKLEGCDDVSFFIVNAYTQYDWRRKPGQVAADYDAIQSVFEKIAKNFDGLKIGYPLIGCGLAGGDWNIVSKIIDNALEGQDHTLVVFE